MTENEWRWVHVPIGAWTSPCFIQSKGYLVVPVRRISVGKFALLLFYQIYKQYDL